MPDQTIPPATEWPPVLIAWLRAACWKRLCMFHDGPAGILLWLLSGNKHPLTGERLPYAPSAAYLYPIALEAAEKWDAKRKETVA